MKTLTGVDIGNKIAIANTRRNLDRLRRVEDLGISIAPMMFGDLIFFLDDFRGDTINLDNWVVTGDSGITVFAVPSPNTAGGVITSDTSTDDNEYTSIYGPAYLTGDKNAGMMIRFKCSAYALGRIEMGLTDPLSDYTLPAVNDVDTPSITNGATTVAVLHMDTSQTLTTLAFVTDGNATYDTQSVAIDGAGSPSGASFTTFADDTFYKVIIQLKGDDAICEIWDDSTPSSPIMKDRKIITSAVEGGDVVQPWFIFGNLTSNSLVATIDYIAYWVER